MDKKNRVMKLNDFVYLLFATLADNSKINNLNDKNRKIVFFPVNYKQIIENVLCADNNWKDEFSCLIDIDDYFEDHFDWELRLSLEIKNMLLKMDKFFEYNFECDVLLISFSNEEIDNIINRYRSEKLKSRMKHFANLLVDYIYTREYQERFFDYSAAAVRKMHNNFENKIYDDIPCQVKNNTRVLSKK